MRMITPAVQFDARTNATLPDLKQFAGIQHTPLSLLTQWSPAAPVEAAAAPGVSKLWRPLPALAALGMAASTFLSGARAMAADPAVQKAASEFPAWGGLAIFAACGIAGLLIARGGGQGRVELPPWPVAYPKGKRGKTINLNPCIRAMQDGVFKAYKASGIIVEAGLHPDKPSVLVIHQPGADQEVLESIEREVHAFLSKWWISNVEIELVPGRPLKRK